MGFVRVIKFGKWLFSRCSYCIGGAAGRVNGLVSCTLMPAIGSFLGLSSVVFVWDLD